MVSTQLHTLYCRNYNNKWLAEKAASTSKEKFGNHTVLCL